MGYLSWKTRPDLVEEARDLRNEGLSYNGIAEIMKERHGLEASENSIRYVCGKKDGQPPLKEAVEQTKARDLPNYKESVEIAGDGSHKSDKLLRMSEEESKDIDFLLRAHGYDAEVWELISARNNIWNSYSKQDGIMTMYSSKISVRPKSSTFSLDRLLEAINELPELTVHRVPVALDDKRMLEIPLFDAHFGISTYDYYKPTQEKILQKIQSRDWEEVLFVVGQDMLHNDNFRGQTANGTQIEVVDMVKAWMDATKFYFPLIEEALLKSNRVKIIFSKGNHDESMTWTFVQLLKERYKQVTVDDSFVERKAHVFGNCFIGLTHGDKARKNLHNIFPREFPMLWAQATTHELHTGHFHVEDAKDVFGMMVRTLATRNKTDQWHKDSGFVGAHKRFMLFEYDEQELKSIHYV